MKRKGKTGTRQKGSANLTEILQNVIVGLTVSFVALSLGAALGLLSGRGAFAGMISAGIIAFITSVFGGTRVQCSGPTAPMSAVSAVVVAYGFESIPASGLAISPNHFVNIVFVFTGIILVIMAIFRLGRFISYVPKVVISGFMSGIALQIWMDQIDMLMGWRGKTPLQGATWMNILVALATLSLIFLLAPITKRSLGRAANFFPPTLLAILTMTGISTLFSFPVEPIHLSESINSLSGFTALVAKQLPSSFSTGIFLHAVPFALQLAVLCYLDTLLTSLVVDKMSGEQTNQNRELFAQGLANSAIAFVGGIPGAQATIRSVLMLKENATLRLSGIMVGVFVLIEMILFQDFLNCIPKAVFVGVLLKVGYDVFDFQPLRLYFKEVSRYKSELFHNFFARHDDEKIFVTNREMILIFGTAAATLLFDLNTAVGAFTLLFYLHNKVFNRKNPMRDLQPETETKAYFAEP